MDDSVTVDPINAKENQAMSRLGLSPRRTTSGLAALLVGLVVPGLFEHEVSAQAWRGYGLDAQHSCLSSTASQIPQAIRWSALVDEAPPFNGSDLFIHYASPLITQKNTVIVTVRSQAGGFYLKALSGLTGLPVWTQNLTTDYRLPPHNWIPTCGSTILPGDAKLAVPGAGGTVYIRTSPDRPTGTVTQLAFYGLANYQANSAGFDQTVFICTPITADSAGNLYFGFTVTANSPLGGLTAGSGGLARISTTTGQGIWSSAAAITGDSNMQKVVNNCAPALSNNGSTVYVAVNNNNGNSGHGYLVAVDSLTLGVQSKASVRLKDVRTPTADASVPDDGSATPTVGPDGDVYFGVLEANLPQGNNDRGWMLHFSSDLSQSKIPGSFGWDDTASIVPAAALGSRYTGKSTYLILTKYNNYADFGLAQGNNMVAILDPNATEDFFPNGASTPVTVMQEVITVLGVTSNQSEGLPGVREWCINSAAIDPVNNCAVINSEDGHVYRWDFASNSLTASVALAQATGEAYTPTVIGPDGAVYAINRAVLNCCISNPVNRTLPTRVTTPPSPFQPRLKTLQPFPPKPHL
jgi:hypothetical protein